MLRLNVVLGIGLFTIVFAAFEFRDAEAKQPPKAPATVDDATLSGPYEDKPQAEIAFGRRSFYLAPWRSYMDTWSIDRLKRAGGINFNVEPEEADAVARLISEAGIVSARVEIGWGNVDYSDPTHLKDSASNRFTPILAALKKYSIRPLILLNANSGAPCPLKTVNIEMIKPAASGDRSIFVKSGESIVAGYSGLRGQAYQTAFPVITGVDSATGECRLSAPLLKPIGVGTTQIDVLKYQPFSDHIKADGSVFAPSDETIQGWKQYAATVCQFVKSLTVDPSGDCGFDLEVWNEYTFGSQFLDIANYYNPAPSFKEQATYTNHGQTRKGVEVILPITVDYVSDPANRFLGVGVISGFSNQRPWDNGVEMWPGQIGFSRHYYTNLENRPFNRQTDPQPNIAPLSALGQPDGKPDGKDWNTAVLGSFFVPDDNLSMPEMWHYGYKTEFLTRDLQPFPGLMQNHFRFAAAPGGRPADVWLSETNTWRKPWIVSIARAAGCKLDDARLLLLSHVVAARADLRNIVFHSAKGVSKIELYAAKDDDLGFSFFPAEFYRELAVNKYVLNDAVRAKAGPQYLALRHLAGIISFNQRLERSVGITRAIGVSSVVEHNQRLVFKGDGSLAHPDRHNRDDLAVLPFQLSAQSYAVGYYVVTHNMVHDWDPSRKILDPARYAMPDQEYELTLTNINGVGATAISYDPLSDVPTGVRVVKASKTSITLSVVATDTPRFIVIREMKPGLLIVSPHFQYLPRNRCVFTVQSSIPCQVTITCGELPLRQGVKTVSAPMNGTYTVTLDLPTTGKPQGVKVLLNAGGTTVTWPRWDYDLAGRLPAAIEPKAK